MINSVAILYGLKQLLFGPRLSSNTVTTFSDTVQRSAELVANDCLPFKTLLRILEEMDLLGSRMPQWYPL